MRSLRSTARRGCLVLGAALAVAACGGGSPASWARAGATPADVAAKYCSTYGQGSDHVTVLAPAGSRFQPTLAELLRDGKYMQSDRLYRQIGLRVEKLGGFGKVFADLAPAKQSSFDDVRLAIEGRCTKLRLGLQIPTEPQTAGSVP